MNSITMDDVPIVRMSGRFDDYQRIAIRSAIYPGQGTTVGLWYCLTKLNGEAGEAAEHIGKAFRDDGALFPLPVHVTDDELVTGFLPRPLTNSRREAIIKELGGVLWYVSAAANELGLGLDEIAVTNLTKLASRTERGQLRGSGDDR